MIFGRKESAEIGEATRQADPVSSSMRERINQAQDRRIQHSILSADLKVAGDVTSKGDITIEGAVDGNIECRCLTLAGEPKVKGSAKAETVLVSGTFTGDIRAKKVILTKTANLVGDIYNESLEIQPGASFEGKVHRLKAEDASAVGAKDPAVKIDEAKPDTPTPQPKAKTAA